MADLTDTMQRMWQCELNEDDNAVTFTLESKDMDQGFPGI